MNEMKQRFVNAVTNQLAAAPDSTAKAELIEELADNLHHRYLDMVADGVTENEAFEQALDELGDADELVDYLKSLSPEEELPKLTLHPDEGLERLLQEAMDAARRAMDAVKQKGKLRTTTLRSDDGEFEFHMDYYDDDHGEHPFGEDHEDEEECDFDRHETIEDTGIPSEGLRGIDIRTASGDVTVRLIDDENAPSPWTITKGWRSCAPTMTYWSSARRTPPPLPSSSAGASSPPTWICTSPAGPGSFFRSPPLPVT